jgi:hypothetical protein
MKIIFTRSAEDGKTLEFTMMKIENGKFIMLSLPWKYENKAHREGRRREKRIHHPQRTQEFSRGWKLETKKKWKFRKTPMKF